jgi:hypothetical protein
MFVFTADVHLQHRAWKDFTDLSGDAFFSFEQIALYANQHKLPLVIGGDVFDIPNPEPELITRYLRILEKYDLTVYFIEGQHDRRYSFSRNYSWAGVYPKAHNIDKQVVRLGDRVIYGLSWRSATFIDQELANIPPEVDMLIAHQVWGDWMPHVYDAKFEQIPVVDTVLTGDLHALVDQYHAGRDGQMMRVYSPGPVCMQSSSEQPKKYFHLVGGDSIMKKELIVRPSQRFNFDSSVSLEDVEFFIDMFRETTLCDWRNDNYSDTLYMGLTPPPHFDKPLVIVDARMSAISREELAPVMADVEKWAFLIYYKPNVVRDNSVKAGIALSSVRSVDELFRSALERLSLSQSAINDLMAFKQEDDPRKLAEAIRDRIIND